MALERVKRPSQSSNKRLKWEYQCAQCEEWMARKHVKVDHIKPAGRLRDYEDLPGFVARLFCEVDGLQVLCKECHDAKTKSERMSA